MDLTPQDMVLDLGCAYGYSSAVIARMVEAVVAVEEDDAMAHDAQHRLSAGGVDNAAVITGPLHLGAAKHGPFDAIIVQGGVETIPDALIHQLRPGGRIGCIFMEGRLGVARIGHRTADGVTWRYAFNAAAPVLQGFEKKPVFAL
jgi:protein-L-isoaspartate(D-aspartate) O-methyltransferase